MRSPVVMLQAASIFGFFASSVALVVYAYRRFAIAQSVRDRAFIDDSSTETAHASVRNALARYRWVPWVFAVIAAAALWWLLAWPSAISVAAGLMVGLLSSQFESYLHARQIAKLETQLADAIDLMVGALSAGAGAMASIAAAASEMKKPLRPLIDELLVRIRLGDDPQQVFGNLSRRVPEETFLLFSVTMAVHWEVGGSLAPTLATLARTIRDRIEVARRIRSNIVQSQVTTVMVVIITYFIALLMWNHDPNSVRAFLSTTVGVWLVAISMFLQAAGIVWMAAMSKMRF